MSTPAHTPTNARGRRASWLAMTLLAALVALVSARYFTLDPDSFFREQRAVYLAHLGPLLLHVTGGVVGLALGPWQFVRRLRARRPAVHRLIGRVYLASTVLAAVGGLLLAPTTYAGPVAGLGFAVLAGLLLAATTAGFVAVRRRQFDRHRAWMIRSYALMFTGVSFRLWIGLLPVTGLPFALAYQSGAWAAWIVNLLVAELLLARIQRRGSRSMGTAGSAY